MPGISSMAFSGVAAGMLLPAVQVVRGAARKTSSLNNMRQLLLACHNYAAMRNSIPAAYSMDPQGKPLLSWRVHVLPYLEEQALYDQFKLDEPWDSPHNRKLIEKMPKVFENPSHLFEPGKDILSGDYRKVRHVFGSRKVVHGGAWGTQFC